MELGKLLTEDKILMGKKTMLETKHNGPTIFFPGFKGLIQTCNLEEGIIF